MTAEFRRKPTHDNLDDLAYCIWVEEGKFLWAPASYWRGWLKRFACKPTLIDNDLWGQGQFKDLPDAKALVRLMLMVLLGSP